MREKLKKGPGHGGIRRSRLRSRSKRGETQKTEIPQRQTKRTHIFWDKQKMLKNYRKVDVKNPAEPRLTDTLRLSGSEPNRAQKKQLVDGKRKGNIVSKRKDNDFEKLET